MFPASETCDAFRPRLPAAVRVQTAEVGFNLPLRSLQLQRLPGDSSVAKSHLLSTFDTLESTSYCRISQDRIESCANALMKVAYLVDGMTRSHVLRMAAER